MRHIWMQWVPESSHFLLHNYDNKSHDFTVYNTSQVDFNIWKTHFIDHEIKTCCHLWSK